MSAWTHSICEDCWERKHPERKAVRVREALEEQCCYCGKLHQSGIYVRENPADMICNGVHT